MAWLGRGKTKTSETHLDSATPSASNIQVTTMNGHDVAGFQWLGRKGRESGTIIPPGQ